MAAHEKPPLHRKGKVCMADRYRQSPDELFYEFSSAATGLTNEQAAKNIEKYGVNELTQAKKKTPLQIFLSQFADFIVIILIIAAAVSMFMGDKESFWVIQCRL